MVYVRSAVGAAVALCAVMVAGCGGSAFVIGGDAGGGGDDSGGLIDAGPMSDGGGEDGSTNDGGPTQDAGGEGGSDAGGGQGTCPTTLPASGAPCSVSGLECEYGGNPSVRCNQVAECTAGAWTYAAGGACVVGVCPPTYASAVAQNCTTSGLVCSYAQGTCGCMFGGGPIRVIDGSIVSAWSCAPAQTGCPSPRPDIGTPCSQPGDTCDYAPCNGGVELSCTGGRWDVEPVACPAGLALP